MGESINFAENFTAKLRSAPRILRLYKNVGINYGHPMGYQRKKKGGGWIQKM